MEKEKTGNIKELDQKGLEKVVGGGSEWGSNLNAGASSILYRNSEMLLNFEFGTKLDFGAIFRF